MIAKPRPKYNRSRPERSGRLFSLYEKVTDSAMVSKSSLFVGICLSKVPERIPILWYPFRRAFLYSTIL